MTEITATPVQFTPPAPQNPNALRDFRSQPRSPEQILAVARVLACTGITYPEGSNSQSQANQCVQELEILARNGSLPQYPAAIEELRGRYDPGNTAAVKELPAAFTTRTLRAQGGADRATICLGQDSQCRDSDVSQDEFRAMNWQSSRLSSMNPNRGLPVTPSTAAAMAFTDALMNPHRYLTLADGRTGTIAEKAGEILATHGSRDHLRNQMITCTENGSIDNTGRHRILQRTPEVRADVRGCAAAAARYGIVFSNNDARYDGVTFLGRQGSAQSRF